MLEASLGWEFDLLYWFQSLHNPVLDFIMAALSYLGEPLTLVLIAAVLVAIPKTRKYGYAVVGGLLLSVLFCNGILKPIVQRVRPYDIDANLLEQIKNIQNSLPSWLPVVIPTDFSFPSGHTSATFATAFAIFMVGKKPGICAAVIAAGVAVSRLYIGIHYPTDVLVSLVLGTLCGIFGALLAAFVVKKITELIKAKKEEN